MHLPTPTRRDVLAGGAGIAATAAGLSAVPRIGGSRDMLVYVFLRGGADALALVPPHGDPDYYHWRPNYGIPQPGQPGGALDLDGTFGLHPTLAPLLDVWNAGNLAVVQAMGSPDPERSHFQQMLATETATPNLPAGSPLATDTGWLGRHLNEVAPVNPVGLRGIALEDRLPRTLAGAPRTLPLREPELVHVPGVPDTANDRLMTHLNAAHHSAFPIQTALETTIDAAEQLSALPFASYVPENGAEYPDSDFGAAMRRAAILLKADIGIEAVQADLGGWDLHSLSPAGPAITDLDLVMEQLAKGLHAFWKDCQSVLNRVTVVCMSEFGRRVDEGAIGGTDHGRGGLGLVLGGNVNTGQVHGAWPGLAPGTLDELAVPVVTDYRDVLAEVLAKRCGNPVQGTVWPGYTPDLSLGIVN